MNRIWFWLKNSRLFSLPMTVLSWLIVFVYCNNGNVFNGILALIGISCVHMATNLFDDYVDYKNLTDDCQKCKCAYIKEGKACIEDVFNVVIIYFVIAAFIGLILFIRCGFPVILLAIIGAAISLCYAKLSKYGFSEIAVGIAFGPLFFEGVCFVMTGNFSFEIFIMSIAVVMFTIGLMYTHTVLDYEGDVKSGKKTLAARLGSKSKAVNGVLFVYGIGYLFTAVTAVISKNYYILSTCILIPLVIDIYKSLKSFQCGEEICEFYKRLLKARNLMVFYSLLFTISIFLKFIF